ncbi:adenylate/guanylate cyclase domain-containing protein [Bradyrhizobium sp. CB82]|uniref:adenylate/guanylate cyclase domain-containing protein n=1 Tax=Bradyrhizobium sp. CB82 TaxID=3039159 RepID=UPI0024B21534|nr:adenylate/guanylate cyclase domain-containing protein [Bradyrhizobium sp. CB82]WFU39020.1 adenylate/guanylate cyclase domain-containing protein [Bradyrhizobium sp. CB82]
MNQLRTTVVMKTDISGSTSRFRELLTTDLQALLGEHRTFLARHAAEHGGRIIKPAGDGYWLEFLSVTSAAKAAIAVQEELRLAQPNRAQDRLSIRIVIALGDIAVQDDDFIGDVFALATRVEAITPPDEIYLTAGARLALASAEVQTALVENFVLKGFVEPMPVYRIEQRHRTRVIPGIYILFVDLHGFGKIMDAGHVTKIERILDMLDAVTYGTAQEFGGTVRFNQGDSYCITFAEAAQAMAGVERLICKWDAIRHLEQFDCTISIALHRGTLYAFRSFLYGRDVWIASQLQSASSKLLSDSENGIFVTDAVYSALFGTPWHNRLQPVALQPLPKPPLVGIAVYRLCEVALDNEPPDPF